MDSIRRGARRSHLVPADFAVAAPASAVPGQPLVNKVRYASLSRHPTVPAMARLRPLLQIRHLDPAQVILRDLVALCLDVDAEEAGGVQAEDLFLQRAGQRRVLVLLDELA